jgi:hypothetical protein
MAKLRVLSGTRGLPDFSAAWVQKLRRRAAISSCSADPVNGTVTVPVPDHYEIRLGTLQSIIRQSCIARSEFESQG